MEIQFWHLAVTGLGALGAAATILGVYHAVSVAPERARRKDVDKRLVELEAKQRLTDQKLEQGGEKMQRLETKLDCLTRKVDEHHSEGMTRLTAIETLMRHHGGLPPEA